MGIFSALFGKRQDKMKLEASQIVPRIKSTLFLKSLQDNNIPEDQMPYTEEYAADLVITYAFDLPEQFIMATPPLLNDAGVDPEALRPLALENLKRNLGALQVARKEDLFRVVTGESLEACILLLDQFWQTQVDQVKGKLIAAVPNRDILIYTGSESAEAMEEMRAMIPPAFEAGANHSLTTHLLERTENGWKQYEG